MQEISLKRASSRLLDSLFCVIQPVECEVTLREVGIGNSQVRFEAQSLEGVCRCSVILSETDVNYGQVGGRGQILWIAFGPHFKNLADLLKVSTEPVIQGGDFVSLPFADPGTQGVGLLDIFCVQIFLPQVAGCIAQIEVGQGKIRIKFDRVLKERNRL